MSSDYPDLFAYDDYRRFLRDAARSIKARKPVFSYRYIGKKVGAVSSGWFANVIHGRISLTTRYIGRLAGVFGLTGKRRDYFNLLVLFNQAGSLEERNHYLKKISYFKGAPATIVRPEQFEFYSHWYISAIRELLFIYDFKGDYAALASTLNPPVTSTEAQHAIDVLHKLGFIQKDAHGTYRPSCATVRKDPTFKSAHWGNLMRAKMHLGIDALERFDKTERDISEVFLPLSRSGFEQAREELKELRKKLLAISEEDTGMHAIYQCNLQLFPMSRSVSPRKAASR